MAPEPSTQPDAQNAKLEGELRALMRDPDYWTSRHIQEAAREACERLYGAPPPPT